MEMFSQVEWKKLNATTQEIVCNYCSELVLCSVNWNMDTWLIQSPFSLHNSQNVCDKLDASKDSFIGNFLCTYLKEFIQKLV